MGQIGRKVVRPLGYLDLFNLDDIVLEIVDERVEDGWQEGPDNEGYEAGTALGWEFYEL